jgi:hypothetical protein
VTFHLEEKSTQFLENGAVSVSSFIFERLDFPRVPNQMNFISRGFTAPSRSAAVEQFETLLSLGATLGTWETRTRESAKKRNRPSQKRRLRPDANVRT